MNQKKNLFSYCQVLFIEVVMLLAITILLVMPGTLMPAMAEGQKKYTMGSLEISREGIDNPTGTEIMKPYKEYIEKKINILFDFKNFDSMDKLNKDLKNGTLQLGYANNIDYLDIKRVLNVIPIVRQVRAGSGTYRVLLVVRKESRYKNLADLKGKSYTYSSKLSPAAYLLPAIMIKKKYKMPLEKYFGKIINTKKDSDAVMAVFYKKADAVYVSNQVWNFLSEYNPRVVKELKVIYTSEPLSQGVVFYYPPNCKSIRDIENIKEAMIGMSNTVKGKQILLFFKLSGWESSKDSDLDTTRSLINNFK